jgi:hypothetical protein
MKALLGEVTDMLRATAITRATRPSGVSTPWWAFAAAFLQPIVF